MYLPTRTSEISVKPSEASPCLTVMPWGSLTTGFGVTMILAIIAPSPFVPGLGWEQRLADQSLVSGQVAHAGLRHDLAGELRRLRLLVPTRAGEPVADELLVIRVRRRPHLIGGRVPVARAVRGQCLVNQDQLAVDEAELELGVREDQAAARRQL